MWMVIVALLGTPALPPDGLEPARQALMRADLVEARKLGEEAAAKEPARREVWELLAAIHDVVKNEKAARAVYRKLKKLPAGPAPTTTEPPAAPVLEKGKPAFVQATRLRLRETAAKDGKAMQEIVLGEEVTVEDVVGEWAKVRAKDASRAGYVAAAYLSPTPPDATALVTEGTDLQREEKWIEATRAFERVYLLRPTTTNAELLLKAAVAARQYQVAVHAAVQLPQLQAPAGYRSPWEERCAAIARLSDVEADTAVLFTRAADLRRRVRKGRALKQNLDDAVALADAGTQRREAIQGVVCARDELASCLLPVATHCESIDFSVDDTWLELFAATGDDQLAMTAGLRVLADPEPVFTGCCSDFGCAQGAVSAADVFLEPDKTRALLVLANGRGAWSSAANEALDAYARVLMRATCSCGLDVTATRDMVRVIESASAAVKATRAVRTKLDALLSALKRPPPAETCELAGTGD